MVFSELQYFAGPNVWTGVNIKNLKTAYEYVSDKYNTMMSKHTFFTSMLSKTNVTFSCNTLGEGYITADIIMVLSHLKEANKGIKAGRVY